MFGPYRRFPFRGLALVALGFLLASVLAGGAPAFSGAAAGVGLLLLIPLIMFKMMFMFFIFGAMLRFVGGGRGRGPWGPGPYGPGHRRPPSQPDDRWSEQEQRDWEESLRLAKQELRDSERRGYPTGGSDRFEPPTPRSED